jgi:hypothetical protein
VFDRFENGGDGAKFATLKKRRKRKKNRKNKGKNGSCAAKRIIDVSDIQCHLPQKLVFSISVSSNKISVLKKLISILKHSF